MKFLRCQLVAVWFISTSTLQAQTITLDVSRFTLSPEVVQDLKDGSLRLARSYFVADEMGATDFHQSEALSGLTIAKKIVVLDSGDFPGGEMFFFGAAKQVVVNGRGLETPRKLVSTGWSRVNIPPGYLKKGENEIVVREGRLLVEPGKQPGRSFKSTDGGKTWDNQNLTAKGNHQGEYLIRLRLLRYASRGWATSPVIDLWAEQPESIATPARRYISPKAFDVPQSEGIRLTVYARMGSTPTPDTKHWSVWFKLHEGDRPTPEPRWAQLKFELESHHPQQTPRLPAQLPVALVERQKSEFDTANYKAVRDKNEIRVSSVPFIYQDPSPRLKLLRERYKLDEVIAPGKTEMEQLMLVRHWVRHQWHTAWGGGNASWMPPWDSLIILESKDQSDCLTMCTHYATVFTQCCLALGWNARQCILDHHCTAEVYSNDHRKWIMMDAGNSAQRADVNLHFERAGVPLSALELQAAYRTQKTDDITVHFTPHALAAKISHLCRPDPKAKKPSPPFEGGAGGGRPDVIPLAELKTYPVCQLENYRRYAFAPRNNFLSSLVPGELYQGWSEYFYDGYCWVGDSPDDPKTSPEYSRLLDPARPQDADWSLNWTRIHLCRTLKPGQLQVDLETFTPNLARLERKATDKNGKESWVSVTPSFMWSLERGANELVVRSVNRWEKAGAPAHVTVSWVP